MGEALGILWRVGFRCKEEPEYLLGQSGAVVDRLAKTRLWKELQVHGLIGKPAKPIPTLAELKKKLKTKDGRTVYLARGGKDALLDRYGAEVRVSIEAQDQGLSMSALVRGEALARLGTDAIDEYADAIADLTELWRPHAILIEACAMPFEIGFTYPRVRPPQITTPDRPTGAIVDVLDAKIPDQPHHEVAVATRAMALAVVPKGVVRRERAGIVIVTWVDDLTDRAALIAACTRHERWLLDLLPSRDAPGWNEDGDLLLNGNPQPPKEPFALVHWTYRDDRRRYSGHVAVESGPDGAVDEDVWAEVAARAKVRKIGDIELEEVRLLADSRQAALALSEAGHEAGYDRVVYRDAKGQIWDPDPPGPWAD